MGFRGLLVVVAPAPYSFQPFIHYFILASRGKLLASPLPLVLASCRTFFECVKSAGCLFDTNLPSPRCRALPSEQGYRKPDLNVGFEKAL